jgi:predicted MPP superfamily phosphohydrolase
LLQSFSKTWIVLSFKINQEYIAKFLCINRDKPEVMCNGKCILMQRVKAEEEKEKKQIPQKLKEQKEVFYCFGNFDWLVQLPKDWKNKRKNNFSHQTPFTAAFVKGIFRPPKIDNHFVALG